MNDQEKQNVSEGAQGAAPEQQPAPIDDAEAAKIVGGTGGTFTQEQLDDWSDQGPVDRSGFGSGAGE